MTVLVDVPRLFPVVASRVETAFAGKLLRADTTGCGLNKTTINSKMFPLPENIYDSFF